MKLWTSRQFLTLLFDVVVSLVLYFIGKYYPVAAEDVIFAIKTLQPVVIAVIVAFTADDITIKVNAARLEMHRLTLGAKK